MTPTIAWLPRATWAPICAATAGWRSWSLPLLSCDASMTRRSARLGLRELRERGLHAGLRVVGLARAAAQDDVPVRVAGRVQDRRRAAVVDAGEGVRGGGGAHGVDGDLHVAVGAVLEADRHRQARAELAVDLALGRARADRRPRDRVGDVLRRDRVEELAADRQAEAQDLEQQLARGGDAGVDVARAVEVRVVDEALPAGRRARLLEVHAHRDVQVVGVRQRLLGQPASVVERGDGVVHAARADDDEQPVVGAVEDRLDVVAPGQHELGHLGLERQALEEGGRGGQRRHRALFAYRERRRARSRSLGAVCFSSRSQSHGSFRRLNAWQRQLRGARRKGGKRGAVSRAPR